MYEQRNLTMPRPAARPTEPAEDTVAADEVVGGTVEVLQRQTLSARFHHRMPAGECTTVVDVSICDHTLIQTLVSKDIIENYR